MGKKGRGEKEEEGERRGAEGKEGNRGPTLRPYEASEWLIRP